MTVAVALVVFGMFASFVGFAITGKRPDIYLDKPKEGPFVQPVRPSGLNTGG